MRRHAAGSGTSGRFQLGAWLGACVIAGILLQAAAQVQMEANLIEDKEILLGWKAVVDPNNSRLTTWVNGRNVCDFNGVLCSGTVQGSDRYVERVELSDEAYSQMPIDMSTTSVFANLTSPIVINFTQPEVSGQLPPEWSQMTDIRAILLRGDIRLTGPLPEQWSTLNTLTTLAIDPPQTLTAASLTGSLPNSWSALNGLTTLKLHSSAFTGTLPVSWSALTSLQILSIQSDSDCEGNCITGTLPTEWSHLRVLRNVTLRHMSLTGPLPVEWANLVNLEVLDLHRAGTLTGELPVEWLFMTVLRELDVTNNNLEGPIPEEWVPNTPRFSVLVLRGNSRMCLENSLEETTAQFCVAPGPNCIDATESGLSTGNMCPSSSFNPLTVALSVLGVLLFLMFVGLCCLNYFHRKRKRRPLVPMFKESRFEQARTDYEKYLRTTQTEGLTTAGTAAGPSAEDALNPDAWNTAFFDQFQPPPPSGEQQAAGTYKSPFAASNAQKQGREVGNYWPAEASDPMVYTGKQPPKTKAQLAEEEEKRRLAEEEEQKRAKEAEKRMSILASTGTGFKSILDHYDHTVPQHENPRLVSSFSGGFESLVPVPVVAAQPSSTTVLARNDSFKPLPPLWQLGSLKDVQHDCDLEVDFQKDVQPFIEKRIGGGAFGDVYKGMYKGTPVAIKLFSRYYQGDQEELMNSFVSEVKLMSKFQNCKQIVRIVGASLVQPYVCILLEYVDGPSLASRINDDKQPPLTYRQILTLGHDIASALAYLHPTVVHRDLKPDNVLLTAEGHARLIDFGISRGKDPFKSYIMTQTGGTPIYMAPEQFNSPKFDEKADVYALGCILYEMYTRQPPWKGYSHFCQIIVAVAFNNERPAIPDDCPENLRRLITKCWRQDPGTRPSCAEVVRLLEIMLQDTDEPGVASSSAGLRSVVSDASTGVVKAASETKSDKLPAVKGAAPDVRAIASTPALDVGAAERAAKVSSRPLVDDGDEPSVRPLRAEVSVPIPEGEEEGHEGEAAEEEATGSEAV
mmetsp:Transcript_24383/g.62578  ORF Transcript_24383/g.62578 Transcript_24383/m.62578 type:complete len:1021 (-) Transcript_24383:270-3332(-)